jgi:hypothetical protein
MNDVWIKARAVHKEWNLIKESIYAVVEAHQRLKVVVVVDHFQSKAWRLATDFFCHLHVIMPTDPMQDKGSGPESKY